MPGVAGRSEQAMQSTTMPTPRLTVLAARDADVAVVLRRGPTSWARLSRWDTATDEVEHGGWIHARVDGRRCDLSPDGRLFGAFVAGHGTAHARAAREGREPHGRTDTWVAISRPPWWRALALWWDGTTWNAGVFFPDASSCTIDGGPPDRGHVPAWFDTTTALPHAPAGREWTTTTVPRNRRHRDGWRLDGGWWRRPLRADGHALVRDGGDDVGRTDGEVAVRWDREVVPLGAGASLDVDRSGRALVARDGRLEAHGGPDDVHVIDDLRHQLPAPRPAPAAAGRWPDAP